MPQDSESAPIKDGVVARSPSNDYAYHVYHANGKLVWTLREGDAEKPVDDFKEQDIVFALRHLRGEDEAGYLIYSLAEQLDNTKHPFKLSTAFARDLPPEVLDRHLLLQVPGHLAGDSGRQLHVVVSARSGVCQAEAFYDDILRPLLIATGVAGGDRSGTSSEDGLRYEVIITKSAQSIKDLARRLWGKETSETPALAPASASEHSAAEQPARTIILLSGDGGVIDLLNGGAGGDASPPSTGPRPSISLLPLGTGNALFHSLHKPLYRAHSEAAGAGTDPETSLVPSAYVLGLRTLFRGVAAPLPAFEVFFSPGARLAPPPPPQHGSDSGGNHHDGVGGEAVGGLVGAIVASYGFHASLVWESDSPEYRKHGDKRFGMAAQALLQTSHAYRADVEVEQRRQQQQRSFIGGSAEDRRNDDDGPRKLERQRFAYVLLTMVSNLERKFTISPASRPLAGDLRLVHFGDVGAERTMEIMMAAYNEGSHVGMTWAEEDGQEDGVGYDAVDAVRVTVREDDPRWRKICVDGTIVEVEKDGWIAVKKISRSRLDVLVDKAVFGESQGASSD